MTDPQTDTSLWRLFLRVSKTNLMALITGPESVDCPVRFSSIELQPSSTPLKALEDAVYATPMLPADFASVNVIIDSGDFSLLPACAEDLAEKIAREMNPDIPEAYAAILSRPFGIRSESALCLLHPDNEINFLKRTFANPVISHTLSAVTAYLSHINSAAGDPKRAWAILTQQTLLMVSFKSSGEIELANRYAISSAEDAAYYILASLPSDSPLMIGGPQQLRNAVSAKIRDYVNPVMPITLSANLLHLLGAAPEAPLDLIMATQIRSI